MTVLELARKTLRKIRAGRNGHAHAHPSPPRGAQSIPPEANDSGYERNEESPPPEHPAPEKRDVSGYERNELKEVRSPTRGTPSGLPNSSGYERNEIRSPQDTPDSSNGEGTGYERNELNEKRFPADPETPVSGRRRGYERNELNEESPPWVLVRDATGMEMVAAAVDNSGRVALDVETTGLNPRTDRARLLSLAAETIDGGSFAYLLDCFAVDPAPLWEYLAGKELVLHNSVFDLSFLSRLGFTPGPIRDTLLQSQVLHGARKGHGFHTLAAVVARELGVQLSKHQQTSDWSAEVLTQEQLDYAARDVLHLPDLHRKQQEQIDAAGLAEVMELETRAAPAVAWLASSGVPFDRDVWNALAAEAEGRLPALEKSQDEIAPRRDGFLLDRGAWNWRSDEQVKEAFAQLGFPLENTRDETLAEIDHPLAGALREFRTTDKAAGTYGKSWPKGTYANGRIYAEWRQLGCITGRMSGGKPNLQNLPGDPRYRACFRAPEGRVLVRADYGQIELRLAARISGDKAMLDAYARGDDLHALTARQMTGKDDVTKQERSMAKPVNFGLIYGLGARSLAKKARVEYGIAMTTEDAERYKAAFFRAYPGVARWHRELRSSRTTEVRTLTGRRVPVEAEAPPGKRANYIVQGSGGDGLKLALALLWEHRTECPGAFPVLAVHDEIVIEADAGRKDEAADWLRKAMVEAMAPLLDPVPVEVEVKAGRTWSGD